MRGEAKPEGVTFTELRRKEVVNICDGARLGHVCDLELDCNDGRLLAIIVPGPARLFGLLRSEEELVIPFCNVHCIGADVILVDIAP